MKSAIVATTLSLLVALGCAAHGVVSQTNSRNAGADAVAKGVWGGEHVVIEVSDKGAEVEFDCARGQIAQRIAVNKQGDFDVPGTFVREHGGPVREDESPTGAPARYSGHISGDTMTLTIVLEQDKEKEGPFTLTHGSRPVLRKCR